ncbi:MAG: hypothetical protein M0026_09040 [Nocardiopsaceae bacterium]|nr:hypothetical protein [Nocardiopsaceae bacterium]
MIDEFRAAFQELIDASVATDAQQFPPAVQRVYHLASQVPADERELALEALAPIISGGYALPGITADLSVVAGALVEMGAAPGPTGTEVMRQVRTMGQGAAVFLHAWERTAATPPPDPDEVTAAAEERVAAELGDTAPTATMCWWTVRRYALAAKTMLSEPSVRTAMRGDTELRAELIAISNQLCPALPEFGEVRALLRMAESVSALVLDRASGRGFRVLFDGIGDNFQLHTLLADALIGDEGQGLAGDRPDPRWSAAFRDTDPDPDAPVVSGWWNLVAADGSWVWNEGVPADIPTVDGEHLIVLDEQPYPRSWNAGRRHPHVRGWLEVEAELPPEEAAQWWGRVAPKPGSGGRHRPTSAAAAAPQEAEAAEQTRGDPRSSRAEQPEDVASVPSATQRALGLVTDLAPHSGPQQPAHSPQPEVAEQPVPQWALSDREAETPSAETEEQAPPRQGGDDVASVPSATQRALGLVTGPAPHSGPQQQTAPAAEETPHTPEERPLPQDGPTAGTDQEKPETPGAWLVPPLPPGVSDSAAWGPPWL